MPNTAYCSEWLDLAYKNIETAKLLIRENHFTDIIAIEIQQAVEKTLKSIFALYGVSIPRTHNIVFLYNSASKHIQLPELDMNQLIMISDYYETERYPGPRYSIPDMQEVSQSVKVAEHLYQYLKDFISK
jgi:HEPN domain-containing protein